MELVSRVRIQLREDVGLGKTKLNSLAGIKNEVSASILILGKVFSKEILTI